MQGQTLGRGVAISQDATCASYVLVEPEKSPENLATMAREAKRWRATLARFRELASLHQLPPELAKRAQFAEEVLATAAENLRLGVCCAIIAQAEDGRILGVMSYGLIPPNEGAINLLAVDPENLAGAPGKRQLRGIGTGMVAALSRRLLAKGTETVYLHPFDQEAATFWSHRGFGPCGAGGLMCVRGRQAVDRLIDACQVRPDCGADGDCVVCGVPSATEAVRIPAGRG